MKTYQTTSKYPFNQPSALLFPWLDNWVIRSTQGVEDVGLWRL